MAFSLTPTLSPAVEPKTGMMTRVWRDFLDAFARLFKGAPGACTFTWGEDTPEGAVTAPVGSFFARTNGGASTTLYVKESGTGNTGWAAK